MSKRNPSVGDLAGKLTRMTLCCPVEGCTGGSEVPKKGGFSWEYERGPFMGKVLDLYRHFRSKEDNNGHGMIHTVAYMKLIALISLSIEFNKTYHNNDSVLRLIEDLKRTAYQRLMRGMV